MAQAKPQGKGFAIAIIGLGVVGISAGLYLALRKPKAPKAAGSGGSNSGGGNTGSNKTNTGSTTVKAGGSTSSGSTNVADSFPLHNGSKGNNVMRLQWALQGLGQKITADGIFGSKTEAALNAITGKNTVANEAELAGIESRQYPATADVPDIGKLLGLNNVFY